MNMISTFPQGRFFGFASLFFLLVSPAFSQTSQEVLNQNIRGAENLGSYHATVLVDSRVGWNIEGVETEVKEYRVRLIAKEKWLDLTVYDTTEPSTAEYPVHRDIFDGKGLLQYKKKDEESNEFSDRNTVADYWPFPYGNRRTAVGRSRIHLLLGYGDTHDHRLVDQLYDSHHLVQEPPIEPIGSRFCFRVDGHLVGGRTTMWFDPDYGFLPRRWTVHKTGDDKLDGISLYELPAQPLGVVNKTAKLLSVDLEYSFVELAEYDGNYFVTSATGMRVDRFEGGHVRTKVDRFRVLTFDPNPDLDALGAFQPAFDNGQPISYHGPNDGRRLLWKDGEILHKDKFERETADEEMKRTFTDEVPAKWQDPLTLTDDDGKVTWLPIVLFFAPFLVFIWAYVQLRK